MPFGEVVPNRDFRIIELPMATLRRALGIFMFVLAAAVLIQVVLAAISDEWGYESDVWGIANWFIAAGIISAFEQSVRRALEAPKSDPFERIASTFMLLLTSALALLFFEQWFAVELFAADDFDFTPERSMNWVAVNVIFIAVSSVIGWRALNHRVRPEA